jgi:hypothetical protein
MTVLTLETPFIIRLNAYLTERWGVGKNIFAALCFTALNAGFAAHYFKTNLLAQLTPLVMICVVMFLFFFHLRAFDEHKDYADDVIAYPDRILSRGLITLNHLKILGGGAILLEAILTFSIKPEVGFIWLGCLIYSVLMALEFGIKSFLKRHIIVYGLSHMVILGFFCFIPFVLFAPSLAAALSASPLWLFALAQVVFGFTMEIGRKIRTPEAEHENADMYSKDLGMNNAVYLACVCSIVASVLVVFVQGIPLWVSATSLGLGLVSMTVQVLTFLKSPTLEKAKKVDHMVGAPYILWLLSSVVFYIVTVR